ncbi:hypothetical protein [Cryobacterium sp. PH31-L1]|uniref:hypothetical protein n=1 Tax=Cryobacterium sp. PH31-L1 TaxID=3046199 RepID=UPI0024BB0A76|nr:hypothetical protein [Cryobacterium sp. PH31-L1]MDJ0376271.1 hypothetical protein [Cryobacterium sp. PH31-L1]
MTGEEGDLTSFDDKALSIHSELHVVVPNADYYGLHSHHSKVVIRSGEEEHVKDAFYVRRVAGGNEVLKAQPPVAGAEAVHPFTTRSWQVRPSFGHGTMRPQNFPMLTPYRYSENNIAIGVTATNFWR